LTRSFQERGTYQSAAPPPADALTFKFPQSMVWLMLGLAIACFGLMVFGLALQVTDLRHASFTLMILCVAMFGSGAVGCLQIFNRSRDTVAVNADGLWYLQRKGSTTFIAWSEVGSVTARDGVQRLVVTDVTGTKKIRFEYQLENFEKLRAFVVEHSVAARIRTPPRTVFHRNWMNRGVILVAFVTSLLFTWLCVRQGQPKPAPIFIGFAVFAFVGLMREPSRVEIANDAIVIRFLGWQRTIPFDSITNIELVDLRDRGNVRPTVIIGRKSGKDLKLAGYREGSITLNGALTAAWHASRGGQAPTTAPIPPSESVQTSPSLPTTFRGQASADFARAVGMAVLLASYLIYWYVGWMSGHRHGGAATPMLLILPFGAIIHLISLIPRSLTIGNDSFTVDYYHRSRVVPFASITNIELIEFRNARGNPVKLVKIDRDGGAILKLGGFKDDAPTLCASLRDAWQRSRRTRPASSLA
jgi:hypothetical protein